MTYILHGENLTGILNFISKLQQDNNISIKKEFLIIESDPSDIQMVLSSVDMFSPNLIVTLDISKMGRMNVDRFIDVIGQVPEEILFVVYSGKELSKSNAFIKNSTKFRARVIPFKKAGISNIFKFCDYVYEGNRVGSYKELRNLLLDGEDSVYILVMLTASLRNISYAKFGSKEYEKLPPFVKSKIKKQAIRFSETSLINLFEKYYQFDMGLKNGSYPSDMVPVLAVESVLKSIS